MRWLNANFHDFLYILNSWFLSLAFFGASFRCFFFFFYSPSTFNTVFYCSHFLACIQMMTGTIRTATTSIGTFRTILLTTRSRRDNRRRRQLSTGFNKPSLCCLHLFTVGHLLPITRMTTDLRKVSRQLVIFFRRGSNLANVRSRSD